MSLASVLVLTGTAHAARRPDQEYSSTDVEKVDKLEVSGRFESEGYAFDNLDFRKLDESSDQAILDSDDAGAFAFTGASLALAYQIDPQVRLVFEAGHRGVWGDDQIGSVNTFGGFLYIPSMYAGLSSSKSFDDGVRLFIGRQYFTLGGLGGARDYVLSDVLDMVRVEVPIPGDFAHITLIPINIFSVSADLSEVNFVSLLGQQYSETFDFRGETLTTRYGAVGHFDGIPSIADTVDFDAAVYGFYSKVGARGTGSDISYDGQLGNFADRDWVANFGVRGSAKLLGMIVPFGHFDASVGIDRKEVVVEDVDCNGFAYGGGVRFEGDKLLENGLPALFGEVSFFDAYGPAYAANGQQYSHGFVGMKGQQAGGQLLNRFMGWHPSAYLGRNGVSDHPQDMERIAGTRVLHADAGVEFAFGLQGSVGWWMMQDGGVTFLKFADLDNITPPYGYSRAEYEAERRLGLVLANEFDVELGWEFGEHVDLFGGAALASPGAFYAAEIDRVAGTALGSPDPATAWTAYAGLQVGF